jgi:predicted PurR-regulated permease PerM
MTQQPFYIRLTIVLFMLTLIFAGLYFARDFLMPVGLAALLAILLNPVVRRLQKWGVNRILAIIIAIILVLLVISGLVYLLSTQLMVFVQDIPELKSNIGRKLADFQNFIDSKLGISPQRQLAWVNERVSKTLEDSGSIINSTLNATAGTLAVIAPMPIYIFFFIFYKEKFKTFLFKVNADDQQYKVRTVVEQIKEVVQNYLSGVLTVIIILAVLNTAGLSILGIKYAVFLGVLAAILNIIPYIGILIGNIIAATVAFITKDTIWYAVGVLILFAVIQFVENNFLTPVITGSKVSLNPLGTIIALIVGGLLWGVVGMIVFIPFLGILKVIFDNVDGMQPYGYLLGTEDEMGEKNNDKRPMYQKFADWIRGKKQEKKEELPTE